MANKHFQWILFALVVAADKYHTSEGFCPASNLPSLSRDLTRIPLAPDWFTAPLAHAEWSMDSRGQGITIRVGRVPACPGVPRRAPTCLDVPALPS